MPSVKAAKRQVPFERFVKALFGVPKAALDEAEAKRLKRVKPKAKAQDGRP